MEMILPQSTEEAADAVRAALAADAPLEIVGRGTKRGWGRPVEAEHAISLQGLSGIIDYQPAELVLTAYAGTPLSEIQAALAAHRQYLAFEPADLGPLYGEGAGLATIGGVLGCNLSGPRRVSAGAARDHFLGFTAINGRGEIFKAGGKVVKNVTGYDLPKLIAGSFGTLVLLTEVTIKVLPKPEETRTLLLRGLDVAAANRAMIQAMGSTHDVGGAAYLSSDQVVGLRIEGSGPSVAHRCQALRRMFESTQNEVLESEPAFKFWMDIQEIRPLLGTECMAIWRLSVPPATGAAVIQDLGPRRYVMDWGGGLIWAALDRRPALKSGHASLMRAPERLRREERNFTIDGSAALFAQVKQAFDPKRIFNRGRMVEGI